MHRPFRGAETTHLAQVPCWPKGGFCRGLGLGGWSVGPSMAPTNSSRRWAAENTVSAHHNSAAACMGAAHLHFSALTRNQLSCEAGLPNARGRVRRAPFTHLQRRKKGGSSANSLGALSVQREWADMGVRNLAQSIHRAKVGLERSTPWCGRTQRGAKVESTVVTVTQTPPRRAANLGLIFQGPVLATPVRPRGDFGCAGKLGARRMQPRYFRRAPAPPAARAGGGKMERGPLELSLLG